MSRRISITGYLINLCKCLLYDMGRMRVDMLLRDVYRGFKGVRIEELWQIYNEMPLIKGAEETFRELRARGYELVIISSGVPDFLVKDVASRLGTDLGFGLEAATSEGVLTGEIGGVVADACGKRTVVERLIRERNLTWEDVVVAADDPNNLDIMERAGISIGVNASYPVRQSATYLIDSSDLREVIGLLEVGDRAVDRWAGWVQDARRKLVHTSAAAVPFAAAWHPAFTIVSLCSAAVIYSISEGVRLNGKTLPLVGSITASCIRRDERRHFVSAPLTLTLGIMASLLMFPYETATVVILILAFADSAATLVGRAWGTMRIPYNRSKSVQGSAAAFASAYLCSALYFPFMVAVAAALVSSLIESLPIRDDNIAVPVGTGIVLTVLAG